MTYTHHIATQPLGVNFSVAMSHFVDDINFTVNIISEKKAEMCAWNTWAVNEKVSVVFNTRECLRCVFYICLNMLKKAKWISLMNDIIRHIGNFSSWVTALSHSFAPWYIYLYVWLLLLYILLSNAASIWPRIFLECVFINLIFGISCWLLKWHLSFSRLHVCEDMLKAARFLTSLGNISSSRVKF